MGSRMMRHAAQGMLWRDAVERGIYFLQIPGDLKGKRREERSKESKEKF